MNGSEPISSVWNVGAGLAKLSKGIVNNSDYGALTVSFRDTKMVVRFQQERCSTFTTELRLDNRHFSYIRNRFKSQSNVEHLLSQPLT